MNGKSQLYVLVNGDYAEPGLDAGHVTEGIGGLFIFNQGNNQWQLAAAQPYITNGAYGSSQLGNFKLVQIAKFTMYVNHLLHPFVTTQLKHTVFRITMSVCLSVSPKISAVLTEFEPTTCLHPLVISLKN